MLVGRVLGAFGPGCGLTDAVLGRGGLGRVPMSRRWRRLRAPSWGQLT